MHKYFADWYRVASLKPQGDLLGNRWKSIKKLGKSTDASRAMDLVRLFMAKPLSKNGFLDECRTIFQETDPAFPMRGNELELRVLAGATIAWCLNNCSDKIADAVAFGLLCTYCKGLHPPAPVPEIVELAEKHIYNRSSELRSSAVLTSIGAPEVNINEQLKTIEEACQSGNVPNLGPPLMTVIENLGNVVREFGQNAANCVKNLVGLVKLQQEETNILWWLFGGFSRDSNDRISDLKLPAACLVAGKELSDLVVELPGPFSAVAFLDKMIDSSVGGEQEESVTIQEAVNLSDREWRKKWLETRKIGDMRDLCPVHFAVEKSVEVDGGEEWLPFFKKSVGFGATEGMLPLDLCVQVYQESLFIRAMAEVK